MAVTTRESPADIRPLMIDIPEADLVTLRRRIDRTRWPRRELVDDRSQGVQLATIRELSRVLDSGLRLASMRGAAQRGALVRHHDRRSGHPLRSREVRARQRTADRHHARLARLGHRAIGDHRSIDGSDSARRDGAGRFDVATFPGGIFAAPRSWAVDVYPTLTYYNKVDRGGHFAAWEEPQLFASELRAAFASLRPPR
jgi:pimeloyl-ACP methyl ester carboxylesterase